MKLCIPFVSKFLLYYTLAYLKHADNLLSWNFLWITRDCCLHKVICHMCNFSKYVGTTQMLNSKQLLKSTNLKYVDVTNSPLNCDTDRSKKSISNVLNLGVNSISQLFVLSISENFSDSSLLSHHLLEHTHKEVDIRRNHTCPHRGPLLLLEGVVKNEKIIFKNKLKVFNQKTILLRGYFWIIVTIILYTSETNVMSDVRI